MILETVRLTVVWHRTLQSCMVWLMINKCKLIIKAAWIKLSFCCSFSSVLGRLLPSKMSALPGSCLTTSLVQVALATMHMELLSVPSQSSTVLQLQSSHYFILVFVWHTTVQMKLQNTDHVHTLQDTIILLLLTMSSIFSCQVMRHYLMSSCVGH